MTPGEVVSRGRGRRQLLAAAPPARGREGASSAVGCVLTGAGHGSIPKVTETRVRQMLTHGALWQERLASSTSNPGPPRTEMG